MVVELPNGTRWLSECYEHGTDDEIVHEHVGAYVVGPPDEAVLVDTGSVVHRESIVEQVDAATAGHGPAAIILSHSDYPHSGNVSGVLNHWEDVTVVASSSVPAAQGLPPETRTVSIGETEPVAGRRFRFVDPPLADRSHTTWIYDVDSGTLVTADGFGHYHRPGDCRATTGTLDIAADLDVERFHREALVWLRYVDPPKLEARLADIFESISPSVVAPIHGNPILAANLDEYLDLLNASATQIADDYQVSARD